MSPCPLILLYTTMWGQYPEDLDPGCCQLVVDRDQLTSADAVVFHLPTMHRDWPLKRPGQLWVAWTMDSDVHYRRQRDPKLLEQFDLRMTYHLDSDVVTAYIGGDAAAIEKDLRKPVPAGPRDLATMFVSSRLNRSGRLQLAKELMGHLDIHSYGKKLNTMPLPDPDLGVPTKMALLARHKFDLSFENAIDPDYVTEKFFDPLKVGTVPVYLGAPNIDAFAPGDRCFINASEFGSAKELADYILYLDQNDAAYAEYFAWKSQPFRPEFITLVKQGERHPFERLCDKIRERLGIGGAGRIA